MPWSGYDPPEHGRDPWADSREPDWWLRDQGGRFPGDDYFKAGENYARGQGDKPEQKAEPWTMEDWAKLAKLGLTGASSGNVGVGLIAMLIGALMRNRGTGGAVGSVGNPTAGGRLRGEVATQERPGTKDRWTENQNPTGEEIKGLDPRWRTSIAPYTPLSGGPSFLAWQPGNTGTPIFTEPQKIAPPPPPPPAQPGKFGSKPGDFPDNPVETGPPREELKLDRIPRRRPPTNPRLDYTGIDVSEIERGTPNWRRGSFAGVQTTAGFPDQTPRPPEPGESKSQYMDYLSRIGYGNEEMNAEINNWSWGHDMAYTPESPQGLRGPDTFSGQWEGFGTGNAYLVRDINPFTWKPYGYMFGNYGPNPALWNLTHEPRDPRDLTGPTAMYRGGFRDASYGGPASSPFKNANIGYPWWLQSSGALK